MPRVQPTRPKPRPDSVTVQYPGADMTADEVEFATAMERYKREKRRPFPSCSEVLEVLRSLGYRRVVETAEPAQPTPAEPQPKRKRASKHASRQDNWRDRAKRS